MGLLDDDIGVFVCILDPGVIIPLTLALLPPDDATGALQPKQCLSGIQCWSVGVQQQQFIHCSRIRASEGEQNLDSLAHLYPHALSVSPLRQRSLQPLSLCAVHSTRSAAALAYFHI